jgi:hypothetical protein
LYSRALGEPYYITLLNFLVISYIREKEERGQRGERIGIVLDIFSVNIKRGRKREKEGYVDYPP